MIQKDFSIISFFYFFLIHKVLSIKIQQHKVPMFFLYFLQNQHVSKNLVLELWTKNLKTIRMQDSLNHIISQRTWGMKLNFWIWLKVQGTTKYYLDASSGCAQAHMNISKKTNSQLYLKDELSYEVSFLHVVRNQLDFLHVGRLQQKQTIMVGISKILVGD